MCSISEERRCVARSLALQYHYIVEVGRDGESYCATSRELALVGFGESRHEALANAQHLIEEEILLMLWCGLKPPCPIS